MSDFTLKVITPSGVKYNGSISSLTIRGSEGYLTVLPRHFPLVSATKVCVCHFECEDGLKFAYCGKGILQVGDNDVKIIVPSFIFKDEINIDRAREAKKRAEERLISNDPAIDKNRAKEALLRAEARIALWEGK